MLSFLSPFCFLSFFLFSHLYWACVFATYVFYHNYTHCPHSLQLVSATTQSKSNILLNGFAFVVIISLLSTDIDS